MSTSETAVYTLRPCPCGGGKITRSVKSWDNPWSGADVSYDLECDECAQEWELNSAGTALTLRSSSLPVAQARQKWLKAHDVLNSYLKTLASQYFATKNLPTKKAEHAHLVGLGISNGSYRNHLEARKQAPLHEVPYLARNQKFVDELVATYGDKVKYEELQNHQAAAESELDLASKNVVTQKI